MAFNFTGLNLFIRSKARDTDIYLSTHLSRPSSSYYCCCPTSNRDYHDLYFITSDRRCVSVYFVQFFAFVFLIPFWIPCSKIYKIIRVRILTAERTGRENWMNKRTRMNSHLTAQTLFMIFEWVFGTRDHLRACICGLCIEFKVRTMFQYDSLK